MSFADSLFGRPLATSEERAEHIGAAAGVPIFGLDALTSAAYGPETALALLIPLGAMGVQHLLPIVTTVLVLLVIVFFSYRQTIAAYPGGGGSYTVASENLGKGAGLVAAAALMIDYILTAAVGIAAGIAAVVSDQPWLQPHTLALCLFVLVALALINMRGTKESAAAFMIPTTMFVGTLLAAVFVGFLKVMHAGGHPVPAAPIPPPLPATVSVLTTWMLLKAFSNGCAAMTGVEAVSNGVTAFREPRAKNAQNALTVIIATLIVLLYGTAWLATKYHIMAMDPSEHGYQSLLSLIVMAVFGRGWIYHFTMWSVFLALAFSANTAFAGFPRLARTIAMNDYLPHVFTLRGRRLLFSHGIYALTGFTFVILIMFGGNTERLISLYAIGAFLAFTLSQAGMVVHWRHETNNKLRYWLMAVNGTGAIATGITTVIVLIAKFTSGAWVTALLIPTLILLMVGVKQHYTRVREAVRMGRLNLSNLLEPLVVIPMARWDRMTEKALRFGVLLSKEIQVINVESEEAEDTLTPLWEENVVKPIREKGLTEPQLITLHSSYRMVIAPLMDYILELERQHPDRKITVLLPELVVNHWWENLLHGQRVQLLKLLLLLRGKQRIIVVDIPWYL
ncbi:MAG TPA: APC family permease [Acidobacteriaceae bacterium]|jgi:amino acid transporter|nr:APC family permease [Acidobacteriaceae bacterium]